VRAHGHGRSPSGRSRHGAASCQSSRLTAGAARACMLAGDRAAETSGHAGQLLEGSTRRRARRACAGAQERTLRARDTRAGQTWRMRAAARTCSGGEGAPARVRDTAAARTLPAGRKGQRPPHAWRSSWRGRTRRGRAACRSVARENGSRTVPDQGTATRGRGHGEARKRRWA
jgi:hypothetical protein